MTANATVTVLPFYQIVEPYLLTAFGMVFSILLTWLCAQFQTRTGIHVSDQARATLQQAADNAAGRVLAAQEGPIAHLSFDTRSPMIAGEVKKMQVSVGPEIAKLGMTPERVADLVLGKIGIRQASSSAQVVVAPSPVVAPVVIPGGH